jgi:hypothetical protein
MSWRGSTSPIDRIFAALPYLLPISIGVVLHGGSLLSSFGLDSVTGFFLPIAQLSVFPIGLIIFIALFALVINNSNINHFIRYNVFQALLINIILTLIEVITPVLSNLLGFLPGIGEIIQVINSTVFLGVVAAGGFSIVQTALGRYAEIPSLSNVVYSQIR